MNTIAEAQSFLDQNQNCCIWYAEYNGTEEAVVYANAPFCKTFGHSLEEIVERKRYELVNPPETPADTIEQYKAEDHEAIERGYFLQRSVIETGKDILVLKIRFDQGIIGMFKVIDSNDPQPANAPRDLDADFRRVMESLRSDLLD
ncbi:MAG: hypothetical protein ABJZ55_00040 [Fuerstiella sp.]